MGEMLIQTLILMDRETNTPIKNIPLTQEKVYDLINDVSKSLVPYIIGQVDPQSGYGGLTPSKFFYEIFLLNRIFEFLEDSAEFVFKWDYVAEFRKKIGRFNELFMKRVKEDYVDYKTAKYPNNCSVYQNAYNDSLRIYFDIKPVMFTNDIEHNFYGFVVLQKKEKQEKKDNEEVENIYEDQQFGIKRTPITDITEKELKKDNKNPEDYIFLIVHYLHPKYLDYFEDISKSVEQLVNFDYCLRTMTIFIFYASLLEAKFDLTKDDKKQIDRILSRFKTKLHSNQRADFDDSNLISMMAEEFEFVVIDMPTLYNCPSMLSQVILENYINGLDNEYIISIDSLIFQKDLEDSFNSLNAYQYILNKLEEDELFTYAKCLKNISKEIGVNEFMKIFKDVYQKIIDDPTYEFFFGRGDDRDDF